MPSRVLPGRLYLGRGRNYNLVTKILAFIAVVCSTINVVGGFLIQIVFLKMFKKEKPKSIKP